MKILSILFCFGAIMFAGCLGVKPQKGGRVRAEITPTNQVSEALQPENPATSAAQSQEWLEKTSYTVPAGSEVIERQLSKPATNEPATTNEVIYKTSAPMPVVREVQRKSEAVTGMAQKDTAREMGVKFQNLKSVQVFGMILIVAGLAMFWPPIRAATGSGTLQFALIGTGVGLIFLSHALVGKENVVIVGVIGVAMIYFFAHRHGKLQMYYDENKNGIPDFLEPKPNTEEKS